MAKKTNWVVFTLGLLSLVAFILFAIPNSKGSENMAMVTMFEPDEAAMLPIVQRMTADYPDLVQTVYRFVAYQFYHYGFPHFAPSALVYKALRIIGQADNMPVVLLSLRQMITLLPMLAGLWILVYMQDQFKTWRSAALFGFLLFIPAVVQNGFWWHPDGEVLLYASLILFFLWKDQLTFGRNFFIAAILCGVLAAMKVVGFFFFLAIAAVLIWGLIEKKLTWKQAVTKGLLFVLIMAVSIVIANPYLLIPSHRALAFQTLKREVLETSKGYGVFSKKGLVPSWPLIRSYYGEAFFLLTAIGLTIWGVFKKENRLLHVLILTWSIPLTIHVLFFSEFKFQYWLPVAMPLFSNLILLLPETRQGWKTGGWFRYLRPLLLVLVLVQLGLFVRKSTQLYLDRTNRAENNPAIRFYSESLEVLEPVSGPMKVYFDYRLYMPGKEDWAIENSFDLLTYDFIKSRNFDLLYLSHQRIRDYLQPSLVGIDPDAFARSQEFYRDADAGKIDGYKLLLRNGTALLFIREDDCLKFYDAQKCQ